MLDSPTRDRLNAQRTQLAARLEILAQDPTRDQEQIKMIRNKLARELPAKATQAAISDRADALEKREQEISALEQAAPKSSSDQPSGKENAPAPPSDPTSGKEPAVSPAAKPSSTIMSDVERRNIIDEAMMWMNRFRDYKVDTPIAINDYDHQFLGKLPDSELRTLVEALREEGAAKAPRASEKKAGRLVGLSRQCGNVKGVPADYVGLTYTQVYAMLESEVDTAIATLVPFVREKEGPARDARRPQHQKGNGMAEHQNRGEAGNTTDRPRHQATVGQATGGKSGALPPLTPGADDPVQAAGSSSPRRSQATDANASNAGGTTQRTQDKLLQTTTDLGKAKTAEQATKDNLDQLKKDTGERIKTTEQERDKLKKHRQWLMVILAVVLLLFVVGSIVASNALNRVKAKTTQPAAAPAKTGTSSLTFEVVEPLPDE